MKKENPKALKHIYNAKLLKKIAIELKAVYPSFDKKNFVSIESQLLKLEMKDRVYLIRDQLKLGLPTAYPKALSVLLKTLKNKNLEGFDLWPYTEFIQAYGLDYPELSLEALKKITVLFTSEFAVRPFLIKDLDFTLKFLKTCSTDKNHHVRRWVSEGSRSRLPWGLRLHIFIKKPELSINLIEPLVFDDELYVRRSVANHLNDLSKDHPKFIVSILNKWKTKAKDQADQKKIDWIIRHALRTLIKKGDKGALGLIGVRSSVKVNLSSLKLNKNLFKLGETLEFCFQIQSESKQSQNLVIDYIIHFMKANGNKSAKVFKLKNMELKPGEKLSIQKKHSLRPITTRKYYTGKQDLEIQVNGKVFLSQSWDLKC